MRITNCYDGIDMTGNSGGAYIDDLQLSSLNIGIEIDGSLDSIRIDKLHWWGFNLTANQLTLFHDTTNIGMQVDRIDDLKLRGCFFITDSSYDAGGATGLYLNGSATVTKVAISDTWFDNCRLVINIDAVVQVSNCHFYLGISDVESISHAAGKLIMMGCFFQTHTATVGSAMVYCTENSTNYDRFLSIHGSYFDTGDDDIRSIYANETSSGAIIISIVGNYFHRTIDEEMAVPTIECAGAIRGTICGNTGRDLGAGAPNTYKFIVVDTNEHLSILGNMGIVAAIDIPATFTSGTAGLNNPAAA